MTDVLIGLPTVAVVALLLGAGWSAVLSSLPPCGHAGFVFRSWVIAMALFSFAITWTFPFNLSVRWALGIVIGLSLLGHALAWGRRAYPRPKDVGRALAGTLLPLAVTVVAIIPAIASWTRLTVAFRVGPDADGWAISAATLSHGNTRRMILDGTLWQLGPGGGRGFPRTDVSLTAEVVNSFLTNADRWALPGTAGSILQLVGPSHLWSLLSLLTAFALLAACTGVWVSVRSATGSRWAAAFGVVLLGLSSSVINDWHEGGMGEVWVMPFCLFLVLPLLGLSRTPKPWLPVAGATGIAILGILPALNDDLFAYAIVVAIALVLSSFALGRAWWGNWWPIVVGMLAGAAAVVPSTAAFASELVLTVQQSGHIGWTMPRWPSLAQAFGVGTTYNFGQTGQIPRSLLDRVLDGLADLGIVIFVLALVVRRLRRPSVLLLAAVVGACLAVYVDTRYLGHSTDYQYFKAVMTLAPAGALAMGHLLGESLNPSRITTRHRIMRSNWVARLTSGVLAVAVLGSAIAYVVAYRAQGTVVPPSFTALGGSAKAQAVFGRYNVVGATFPPTFLLSGLLSTAVGAEVNLNWVLGGPVVVNRPDDPVGYLVFEQYCPNFGCLEGVPSRDVVLREGGIALVRLEGTSRALSKLPNQEWAAWSAKRFRELGGGSIIGAEMTATG